MLEFFCIQIERRSIKNIVVSTSAADIVIIYYIWKRPLSGLFLLWFSKSENIRKVTCVDLCV